MKYILLNKTELRKVKKEGQEKKNNNKLHLHELLEDVKQRYSDDDCFKDGSRFFR